MNFEVLLLNFVFGYISYACFIGYTIGLWRWNYKPMRPVTWLLLVSMVNQTMIPFLGMNYPKLYYTEFHFFNPIQLLLQAWFFYINLEKGPFKKSIPWVTAGALLFAVINAIFFQPLSENPGNFLVLETFVLIIWSTVLFIEKLDTPGSVNVFKDPVFITTLGILCFNLFSFVHFLFFNYFIKHNIDQFRSIQRLLYFAIVVYYGLLVIAYRYTLKFKSINQK